MNLIKKYLFDFLKISITSLLLLLITDYFFGRYILHNYTNIEERYRVVDTIFHHSFLPNFDGVGYWGGNAYDICTNSLGFKDSCNKSKQIVNNADVVFIGDSFTEGIGLPFEDTFVGQIALAKPQLRIMNMGVASYSPSIYLSKVRKFVDDGLQMNELVVYIDISDIMDEAVFYEFKNGIVYDKNTSEFAYKLKVNIKSYFQLTSFILTTIKKLTKKYLESSEDSKINNNNYSTRGEWTYNSKSNGYGVGGVDSSIIKTLEIMDELYIFLNKKGIKLSIGIYPWPNQILYDTVDSRQVSIWRDFCKNRCQNFYNSFDNFFDLKKSMSNDNLIEYYFIVGDVHHNKFGAKILAENFLNSTKLSKVP